MRILVVVVGRVRDAALAQAVRSYETRAAHYWPLEVREVREESGRGLAPARVREREGERLLAAVGDGAQVVACDASGRMTTSEEFATWLQRAREQATRDVAFVIGGAYGLAAPLLARVSERMAFSRWTFPHEMARLVLAEQLYRAGTLMRGEPYHK